MNHPLCFRVHIAHGKRFGNLITEQFNYTDFDSIQISNVFEVEISQSDTCSISVRPMTTSWTM